MTTIKHNFTTLFAQDNPITGLILEVNDTTNYLLIYSILLLIFIVSNYSFMKKTQDIGKSAVSSFHIVTMLSLLLFYAGVLIGTTIIPGLLMLFLVTSESILLTWLYFNRIEKD